MLQRSDIQSLFFLGIGGIGMSALARYFHARGYRVYGYDRTPSPLTDQLQKEGLSIFFEDQPERLAAYDLSPLQTLVVRTPAVPEDSRVYTYLREQGYDIRKRSEVLGLVTESMKALCVAGTHGKTTTSTILAHLLYQSEIGTNAFLGGVSNNYQTNLLLHDSSYVVIEADEYDRSFHHLKPYMSVITSVDPDHLDIYGTPEAYREAVSHYTSLITGALVVKKDLPFDLRLRRGVKCYTYAVGDDEADFYADNIRVRDAKIYFDFHTPTETLSDLRLGVPVWVNIENSVAAMAVAWLNGVSAHELRSGLSSFSGVWRRFNVHVHTPHVAYIDDYAHHPQELRASVESIRRLFPDRYSIVIFQPHLYTRTRDFLEEFAGVLSRADEVILLPIYPARELPIPGVTSDALLSLLTSRRRQLVEKDELVQTVVDRIHEIDRPVAVMTLGAGDIDRLVPAMKKALLKA
ncbi:MAG: UDP-N-acetylmuramate--L-alanine ligase [Paludibacteraceae bacterium]|nr:UDP-N-acetylmuramate--L-alanine ligase [Paludibacteraceae bacterium]